MRDPMLADETLGNIVLPANVPVDEFSQIIKVGSILPGTVAGEYRFNRGLFTGENDGNLQSVEVVGRKKTAAEKFEETQVSSMFKTQDAYRFDGLESNQFIGWTNIFGCLQGTTLAHSACW